MAKGGRNSAMSRMQMEERKWGEVRPLRCADPGLPKSFIASLPSCDCDDPPLTLPFFFEFTAGEVTVTVSSPISAPLGFLNHSKERRTPNRKSMAGRFCLNKKTLCNLRFLANPSKTMNGLGGNPTAGGDHLTRRTHHGTSTSTSSAAHHRASS